LKEGVMPYFSQKVILPLNLYIKPVINTDVMHEKIYGKFYIANVALAHQRDHIY
jgi:hypothetical protein